MAFSKVIILSNVCPALLVLKYLHTLFVMFQCNRKVWLRSVSLCRRVICVSVQQIRSCRYMQKVKKKSLGCFDFLNLKSGQCLNCSDLTKYNQMYFLWHHWEINGTICFEISQNIRLWMSWKVDRGNKEEKKQIEKRALSSLRCARSTQSWQKP